jgi:hypothetical protein
MVAPGHNLRGVIPWHIFSDPLKKFCSIMKTIIFMVIAFFFVALPDAQAQSADSTRKSENSLRKNSPRKKSRTEQDSSVHRRSMRDSLRSGQENVEAPADKFRHSTKRNKLENMIRVDTTSLPNTVLTTVRTGPKYKGWKNGMFYKTKEDDMYILIIPQGELSRRYVFAHTGNEIDDYIR